MRMRIPGGGNMSLSLIKLRKPCSLRQRYILAPDPEKQPACARSLIAALCEPYAPPGA
jgi:hypothetical protein